jgi:hypothetical protein
LFCRSVVVCFMVRCIDSSPEVWYNNRADREAGEGVWACC